MKALIIINGSAYGLDSTYNAIRLAADLATRDGADLTVFLMGDGVTVAMAGQKTPDGYYKLDGMLGSVTRKGARSCVAAPAWTLAASSPKCSSPEPAARPWRNSPTTPSPPTRCSSSSRPANVHSVRRTGIRRSPESDVWAFVRPGTGCERTGVGNTGPRGNGRAPTHQPGPFPLARVVRTDVSP